MPIQSAHYVTLRVPDDLLKDMRRRAENEDRSVSALIRQAVRGYIKENDRSPNE